MNLDIKETLKQLYPQFEDELIEEILEVSTPVEYKKGAVLYRSGHLMQKTTIILSGSIKIYREVEEKSFALFYLNSPSVIGISASENSPTNKSGATIEALEPLAALILPLNKKDELASRYNSWFRFCMMTAVSYYAGLIDLIDNIAFRKMDERILFLLNKMTLTQKKKSLRITHQEIADDLNSTREVISRLLKKLEEMGKIRLGHNSIEVITPEK